ncbi:MAG: alkylation repair protein [Paenibacillus sp.]|nr:alkylation repair protein [Paenibacillus sp.]
MEPLKNLYTRAFLERFADIVKQEYNGFDTGRFLQLIYDEEWEARELKQRMRHIAVSLTETLPPSYAEALGILTAIAPQCRGFEYLFFPEFIEINGLEYYDLSIAALEHFTRFSSCEFAVRPFIVKYPDAMMNQMLSWAHHDNEHVRRLASEGCRPRLPWAMSLNAFKVNPAPILPILETLKEDSSEYVRKSVANNLNDIAKDHPGLVLELAHKWHGHHAYTDWIVRHGCRTLLKKGNPQALALFGFTGSADILANSIQVLTPSIRVGEELVFSCSIQNNTNSPKKLRVEYEIGFVKANGNLSPKRFKLSEKEYGVGDYEVTKKHSFKLITTRQYYAGTHQLSIFINGQEMGSVLFDLTFE